MTKEIRLNAFDMNCVGHISGEVEADETFIGGLASNMHRHVRERKIKVTGGSGKAAVLGMVERSSEDRTSRIKTSHVPNVKRRTLAPEIRANVEQPSIPTR